MNITRACPHSEKSDFPLYKFHESAIIISHYFASYIIIFSSYCCVLYCFLFSLLCVFLSLCFAVFWFFYLLTFFLGFNGFFFFILERLLRNVYVYLTYRICSVRRDIYIFSSLVKIMSLYIICMEYRTVDLNITKNK